MTREELIEEKVKEIADCCKRTYCERENDGGLWPCDSEEECADAARMGIDWASPIPVWHGVEEKPEINEGEVFLLHNPNMPLGGTTIKVLSNENWDKYVNKTSFQYWAYLKDILSLIN